MAMDPHTRLHDSPFTVCDLEGWLTAAFSADARLSHCECHTIGGDVGFLSSIFRAELRWEGDSEGLLPHSAVIKVLASTRGNSLIEAAVMRAAPEVLAENAEALAAGPPPGPQWLGHLNNIEGGTLRLLQSAATHQGDALKTPKVYYWHGFNADKPDVPPVLVMEDCGGGTCMHPFAEGLTLEQTRSIVAEMARIHACSLRFEAGWHDMYADFEFAKPEQMHVLSKVVASSIKTVKPELSDLVDRILPHFTAENIERSLMRSHTEAGVPPVLQHGDLWSTNVLFRCEAGDAARASSELGFIVDWQMCRPANGLADVVRLLWSSVEPHVWKPHLSSLLDHYYDSMQCAYGTEPLPFTRQNVDRAYETCMPFVMIFTLFGVPMWADIEGLVGKPDDPERQGKVDRIYARGAAIMEEYLAIHGK